MRVELPWINPVLSPNARTHWAKLSRAKKKARQDAATVCSGYRGEKPSSGPVRVSLTFCAPDKRRRDLDNAIASMKAALDGVSDALGIDDNEFILTARWGDVRKGGAVVVEVSQ